MFTRYEKENKVEVNVPYALLDSYASNNAWSRSNFYDIQYLYNFYNQQEALKLFRNYKY